MKNFFPKLSGLVLCCALAPASAAVLTNLSFTSNGGSFINDTIVNGTSPLAFTANTGANQPFLNASDSTLSLSYGSYYALAFAGFGAHVGEGQVAFLADGVSFSQNVVFPDPSVPGVLFDSVVLPNGDSINISTAGILADRITIAADGGGLQPGGTRDGFYSFNYTRAAGDPTPGQVPEPATLSLVGAAIFSMVALRRRRK